jgi:hypothetical protein
MTEKTRNRLWWAGGVLLLVVVLALTCGHKEDATPGAGSTTTKSQPATVKQLTSEQENAIYALVRSSSVRGTIYGIKVKDVLGDRWLDVEVRLPLGVSDATCSAYAMGLLVEVREGLLSADIKGWSVMLTGPPPGTGLVYLYGTANMAEGGDLHWKPGKDY